MEHFLQNAKRIAEGNGNLIYLSSSTHYPEDVVVKIPKKEYGNAEHVSQLANEYSILRHIDIQGVRKPLEKVKIDNRDALILEYVDGQPLTDLADPNDVDISELIKIAINISYTLNEIHQLNIVHKDINSNNILVNVHDHSVNIIDFGLATKISLNTAYQTYPEVLDGTLAYIAPEQTGRMNRIIDHRSDLYSLGVSLYEWLTGRLPFESDDPMKLIHAHLAIQPVYPHEINPHIPEILSKIIVKLLAKNTEERYQSAIGLQVDLQKCLDNLKSNYRIEGFKLAQKDFSGKLNLPQKLYGRETEIEALLKVFEKTMLGEQSEVVFVSGDSGMGKTSLVNEIRQTIVERHGFFCHGKLDSSQTDTPYFAVIQAFKAFADILLTEKKEKLESWKKTLNAALGAEGKLLTNVIPNLEWIIGEQPEVPELGGEEAHNRFVYTFKRFVKEIATREHPLILFIDDLQWIDRASLSLLEALMLDKTINYFLPIFAFREGEVGLHHPVGMMIEQIKKHKAHPTEILLSNLAFDNVNELLADTLHCKNQQCKDLAEVVFRKTHGNAFFVNQFLKLLYEREFLKFDFTKLLDNGNSEGWSWDLKAIEKMNFTENVVEFMSNKVKVLDSSIREVLECAACIGNRFELKDLAVILDASPAEAANALNKAMEEELIVPVGKNYKYAYANTDESVFNDIRIEYCFAHDQIQLAAYSLIPLDDRREIHYRIGRRLLITRESEEIGQDIFQIVHQMNHAEELISDEREKFQLARLNLEAGKRAKATSAYFQAFQYLQRSVKLTKASHWKSHYKYTLSLYRECAEAAYLIAEYETSKQYINLVLDNAQELLDKVKAYTTLIKLNIAQNQPQKAIEVGMEVLKKLDVSFPEKPGKLDVLKGMIKTKWLLFLKGKNKLEHLPEMTDPHKLAAFDVMSNFGSIIYRSVPELFPLFVFKLVQLSIKYGNARESIPSYAGLGIIECGVLGNIESGTQFAKLALRLLDKFKAKEVKARTYVVLGTFINHWKEHVRESLQLLQKSYHVGLETGDQEFAASSLMVHSFYSYAAGENLSQLKEQMATYSEKILELNQELIFTHHEVFRQAVLNLTGENDCPYMLVGEAIDGESDEFKTLSENDNTVFFYSFFNKLVLCYLLGQYELAYEHAQVLRKNLDKALGTIFIPQYYFFDSLTLIACADLKQIRINNRVASNQKKLKKWSKFAPANFSHKYHLVQAERYRVNGESAKAKMYYDEAIELAKDNGYVNEEALACELTSKFYHENNQKFLTKTYLEKAYEAYMRWGAQAKLNDLEDKYPLILSDISNQKMNLEWKFGTPGSSDSSLASHDLSTVLKASKTISSQIKLDNVLENLLNILIENAGAQKGYLFLAKYDEVFLNARANVEHEKVEILDPMFLSDCDFLPQTIIQYVARSKESVILSNASEDRKFSKDPFIKSYQPKSILCAPIVNHRKLIGIIYLENNLTVNAFTTKRLEMLRVLSGQIAVSLENSLLYDNLEQEVVMRTREINNQAAMLRSKNEELITLNEEKDDLIGIVAHDLRSPLNQIKGLANLIRASGNGMSEDQVNLIDMIVQSSERLTNMISRILDVNAIEAKNIDLKSEEFDMGQLIKDLTNNFQLSIKEKDITMQVSVDKELPQVFLDKNYTIQVFENLISNAIKFSPKGKRIILNVKASNGLMRVEVQDEGPGISQKDMKKLFSKFQQLSAKPTAGEKSTGLGLSIVKKYVEAMKGKIWCESEEGKGSKFIVEFPLSKKGKMA